MQPETENEEQLECLVAASILLKRIVQSAQMSVNLPTQSVSRLMSILAKCVKDKDCVKKTQKTSAHPKAFITVHHGGQGARE